MREDNLFERIESWLDGSMSKAEADDFSKRIDAEPELNQLVEKHKKAQIVVEDWATQENIKMIRNWKKNNYPKPEPEKKKFSKYRLLLSIIAGITVIAGIYFINNPSEEGTISDPPFIQDTIKLIEEPTIVNDPNQLPKPIENKKRKIAENKKQKTSSNNNIKQRIEPEKLPITLLAFNENNIDSLEERIIKGLNSKGLNSKSNYKIGSKAFQEKDYPKAHKYLILVNKEAGMDYTNTLEMLAVINYRENKYSKAADNFLKFSKKNFNDQVVEWRLLQFLFADYENRKNEFWALLNDVILTEDFKHDYRDDGIAVKQELEEKGIRE